MKSIKRYAGGETVKGGFYWNQSGWEAQVVPHDGGVLPGEPEKRFVRVPVLMVLLMAPFMGAAYAMFLPFIGFALVTMYVARKIKLPAWLGGERVTR